MKMPAFSLLVSCLILPQLLAGPRLSTPRLIGIVNLSDQKAALLDFSPCLPTPLLVVLSENQRQGAMVEAIRVNPVSGTAELRLGWTNASVVVSLKRQGKPPKTDGGSLEFADAGIDPVLSLYAEFTGRTLIRSPRIPPASFTLIASTTNRAQAALALEKALVEKGITAIPDGEHLLIIMPESEAAIVKPHVSQFRSSTGKGRAAELLPAGTINPPNTDLKLAAQVSAGLIGRTLELKQLLSGPTLPISFKNQTPLTKTECVHALDILFRLQGVKVVPVGNGMAALVSISEVDK